MRRKAGEQAPMGAGSALGGPADQLLDPFSYNTSPSLVRCSLGSDYFEVSPTMFYDFRASMSSS